MKKKPMLLLALAVSTACALSGLTGCGDSGTDEPSAPHTTHTWSASYTEDGERHYQTCNGCDEKKYSEHDYTNGDCVCGKEKPNSGTENPPAPHTHTWSESCTEDGVQHYQTCSGCDEKKYSEHDYSDGDSDCVCGKKSPETYLTYVGLEYVWYEAYNGYAVVGAEDESALTEVAIPSEISGYPVTGIGEGAFYGCSSLTSVTIPDSVILMGDGAFEECSSLQYNEYDNAKYLGNENNPYSALIMVNSTDITTCTIHKDTKVIQTQAFEDCESLKSIIIPDGVKVVGYATFGGCQSLESVVIPDSVTRIGFAAFASTALTSVTIPDSVTYLGGSAFTYCPFLKSAIISNNVTSINEWTFRGCSSLENISIPDSVTSIDSSAFENCSSLQYNEYDNALYLGNAQNPYVVLMKGKSNDITDCAIHKDAKIIVEDAFYRSDSLATVTIPDGLTNVDLDALNNASSLSKIIVSENNTHYAIQDGILYNKAKTEVLVVPRGISGHVTIPDSITSITRYAFSECSLLVSVTIGNNVTSIGTGAFSGCSSLVSVTIGKNVTEINYYAFKDCNKLVEIYNLSSLTITYHPTENGSIGYNALNIYQSLNEKSNLTTTQDGYIFYTDKERDAIYLMGYVVGDETELILPDSFNERSYNIYNYAFQGCRSLTSITISGGVTSIGAMVFDGCTSLKKINISDSVTSVGKDAFSSCRSLQYNEYENALYLGNEANPYMILVQAKDRRITACTIHEDTKIIGDHAFIGCTRLESIIIPNGVTSIGSYAFSTCNSLERVTIPDSVINMGNYVFAGSRSLTSITIPDSVTSIGYGMFEICSALKNITISNSVTIIYLNAFRECKSLETVYYKGTAEEWLGIEIHETNYSLTSATKYYYSETEPTEEGNYWHYDSDGVTPVVWGA